MESDDIMELLQEWYDAFFDFCTTESLTGLKVRTERLLSAVSENEENMNASDGM